MPIISNQQRSGRVLIRTQASESYIVAGNSSVSNLVTAGEIANSVTAGSAGSNGIYIIDAHITKLFWSTTGSITVARGANTEYVLYGSDHWNLEAAGMSGFANTANLVITVSGAATLLIELKKNAQGWLTDY
jgi:hypothetical protein